MIFLSTEAEGVSSLARWLTHSYLCRQLQSAAALEMRLLAGVSHSAAHRLTQLIFLVRAQFSPWGGPSQSNLAARSWDKLRTGGGASTRIQFGKCSSCFVLWCCCCFFAQLLPVGPLCDDQGLVFEQHIHTTAASAAQTIFSTLPFQIIRFVQHFFSYFCPCVGRLVHFLCYVRCESKCVSEYN